MHSADLKPKYWKIIYKKSNIKASKIFEGIIFRRVVKTAVNMSASPFWEITSPIEVLKHSLFHTHSIQLPKSKFPMSWDSTELCRQKIFRKEAS